MSSVVGGSLPLDSNLAASNLTQRLPHSLLVLKDGHVGSEWFAEELSRQPATRFVFEMGSCTTGSMESKQAYMIEKRGCSCNKDNCKKFRLNFHSAPCFDQPSASTCRLVGASYLSVASPHEEVSGMGGIFPITHYPFHPAMRSLLH